LFLRAFERESSEFPGEPGDLCRLSAEILRAGLLRPASRGVRTLAALPLEAADQPVVLGLLEQFLEVDVRELASKVGSHHVDRPS
jgi:hypothetical protein